MQFGLISSPIVADGNRFSLEITINGIAYPRIQYFLGYSVYALSKHDATRSISFVSLRHFFSPFPSFQNRF
jgi:hypothetical protein